MSKITGYSARNESIKLSILLSILCLVLIYGDWLWRLDRVIYDAQSSMVTHQASNDIVIIAIDEASLKSIGRWPWSRDVHARLIDKLTQYQARAIIIDVIFSEPTSDTSIDRHLAQAIKRNGKVVLPVLLEQSRLRGQLLETLPLPFITQASSAIGHVHVELDSDGIARGSHLFEGLGEAHWPHIGMAVLKTVNEVHDKYTSPVESQKQSASSPWTWVRKEPFLIPYIGPPGSFNTTSYINVLNDQVLSETLKDKIVLVGVTASGLGDSLPTPVSGLSQPMPGIEINANIVQAVKSGTLIHVISPHLLYIISALLVMLPILLFPFLTPRITLLLVISELVAIFGITLGTLHVFHIWVPLSATLSCLVLAYPLWAWRRLEFTVKYLNSELDILSSEANELQQYVSNDTESSFETLQDLIPVLGIVVYGTNNEIIYTSGKSFGNCTGKLNETQWSYINNSVYGRKIFINDDAHRVCIIWDNNTSPDEKQTKILKTYIRKTIKPQLATAKTTVEIIESRINDIKLATEKLGYLRHFITDSFEQMADGIVVIDNLGVITMINRQATKLIGADETEILLHKSIMPILASISLTDGHTWESIINSVLSDRHFENIQVRTTKNNDLVINVSPLHQVDGPIIGFIINISDISEIKDAQRKHNEMLSFLSHDFRSPLVSILAMLEQNKSETTSATLNQRIEHNINHTIHLAEEFIHLSRVESDDDINFTDIDLSDVIANAVDTVWDQASIKQIEISQNINCEGWVRGNGSILERVLINILTNSIKYSDNNCPITITLNKDKANITCCIQDNGPGIDKADMPFLFDRFERARHHTGKPSGIGLGLAFVDAAIKRHHGNITVSSKPGQGTNFCFTIEDSCREAL